MGKEKVTVGSKSKKIIALTAAGAIAVAGVGIGLGVGLSGGNDAPPPATSIVWEVDTEQVSDNAKVSLTNNDDEHVTTLAFAGLAVDESVEFDISIDNWTETDYVYLISLGGFDPDQVKIELINEDGTPIGIIGENTPLILAGDREEGGITVKVTALEEGATGSIAFDVDMQKTTDSPVETFVIKNQEELDAVLALDTDYPITATVKELPSGSYNLSGVEGNAVITKNLSLKAENGANVKFGNINVANNVKLEIAGAQIEGNIKIVSTTSSISQNNTTAAEGLLVLEDVSITGTIEATTDSNEKAFNVPTIFVGENVQAQVKVIGDVEINAPVGAAGIGVAETGSLELFGEGKDAEASLVIKANGATEEDTTRAGTSAIGSIYQIGGKGSAPTGKISIHDLNGLEAYAYGLGAAGIGGSVGANSLDITNVHIVEVKGGMPGANIDLPYGNKDKEAGPAIGFCWSDVEQTLNMTNVTIDKATGGSKSAGIGGNCWNSAIAINITNCELKGIVGGNSGAGIGAGRPANGIGDNGAVTITIANSTVEATGGYRAAGIGGGYSDNCMRYDRVSGDSNIAPDISITITGNSTITAVGGQYAAAIGTGYHGSKVTGSIASTVTLLDCVAGGTKDDYSEAQIVGLGALDPSRDGSLVIDGLAITVDGELTNADAQTIQDAIAAYNEANGTNIEYDPEAKYYVESGIVNNGQIVNTPSEE